MKNMRTCACLLLMLLSRTASAGTGSGAVQRTWKAPGSSLSARVVMLTSKASELIINVSVTLEGEIPLRIGETETLAIEATKIDGGASDVVVRLVPQNVVYGYQDLEGTLPFIRTISVSDGDGSYDCSFRLTSRGRLRITPPNTISEALLRGTPTGQRLNMTWKDAGNSANVPTVYGYELWETKVLWWDKLIAKGEVPSDASNIAQVEIGQTGSPTGPPPQLFFDNHHYLLVLKLKRKSPDYRDEFSTAVRLPFRFRIVPAGFAERIVTPFGTQLGLPADRDLFRAARVPQE